MPDTETTFIDRLAAWGVVMLTVLVAMQTWGAVTGAFWVGPWEDVAIRGLTAAIIVLYFLRVRASRRAFIIVGLALVAWLWIDRDDWLGVTSEALDKAAFIASFFAALATLRNVAETSPALRRAGNFLAAQAPGRRYAALTGGGHLFALLLNYGSISLLGSLATQAARDEPDAELRGHRTRRMLLAIQRGFLSSLTWSPLAFSLAISTALIPGATWFGALLPGLVSAALLLLCGWAMDSLFKPRLSRPPAPRRAAEGNWALILPLFGLLVLLGISVGGLHLMTGLRVVSIVLVVVPVIAASWAVMQARNGGVGTPARMAGFVTGDLTGYRGELSLLMMAGFIGTAGAPLLQPLIAALGVDLTQWPIWVVLAMFVWLIPLLGQLGMNPILAVTLLAPLIPDPASLGVSPSAIVVAIVAGWSLSGATSPFTATTLLIGAFGGVSAGHVGRRWNGGYFFASAALLTGWVLLFGLVVARA